MDSFSFHATDKRKRTQFRGHCVFIWKNNTVASLYSLWLATVTSSCPCSVVSAPEFAFSQLVTLYFTACRKIRITGRRFCRPRWILFVAMNIWSDAGGIVVNTPHLLFFIYFACRKPTHGNKSYLCTLWVGAVTENYSAVITLIFFFYKFFYKFWLNSSTEGERNWCEGETPWCLEL